MNITNFRKIEKIMRLAEKHNLRKCVAEKAQRELRILRKLRNLQEVRKLQFS